MIDLAGACCRVHSWRVVPDTQGCPCCGLATLSERAPYEICSVCWWEDDGQDNEDANEPSGPNVGMSLTQARANYLRYGISDPARKDPPCVSVGVASPEPPSGFDGVTPVPRDLRTPPPIPHYRQTKRDIGTSRGCFGGTCSFRTLRSHSCTVNSKRCPTRCTPTRSPADSRFTGPGRDAEVGCPTG